MKSSCPSLPPNSNCKGRSGTSIVFNPVAGRIVYENLARRDIDIPLGPLERAVGSQPYPDFVFPQMTNPELAPPDWEPGFVDYLYVSFTNAMAFSPTDVMPMTRWAKLTMLTQSVISVIILVLVIARAVNILK